MGKLRGMCNSINSMGLTNGHSDNDNSTTPLHGVVNGDGSQSLPTTATITVTNNNGRSPARPITNGPCKNHNEMSIYFTPDGMISRKFPPTPDSDDEEIGERGNDRCGVGAFKPKWLKSWANKKVFLAVFCLTSVLQGMYYTYFVSVLTTIEKLFQIQSKTTGIIMSATEMGQIGGALLLTYYGGQGHRPKWIACGMIVFAVASFLCSLPHFIYGAELSQKVLLNGALNRSELNKLNLCHSRTDGHYTFGGNLGSYILNATSPATFSSDNLTELAAITNFSLPNGALGYDVTTLGFSEDARFLPGTSPHPMTLFTNAEKCQQIDTLNHTRITKIVLTIFFISLLFIGIGATAVYTLGIPYIDDNVANRDSPLYFAITIGVRILGPVFGFLLGSFCTSLYVEPLEVPIFNSKDTRWIGAWWLGLFIVAAALMVSSLAMFAFPKQLIKKKKKKYGPNSLANNCHAIDAPKSPINTLKKPSLKDFPVALRRLLKNDILLCRTASSVLHILPIAGLYTFLPKYIESQFRMTATEANMVSGMAGILVMGIGIFASGMYMRRFKPNARFVAGWIAVTALAYAIGMVILTFVGCPLDDFASHSEFVGGIGQEMACNSTCNCNLDVFAPVCTSEGITYYSACHAGCKTHLLNKTGHDTVELFINCTCLSPGITAKPGYCPLNCNNFVWYVCIFALFVLIHSTSEVGSMLLTLRCVDPKDKAMALGLISFAIGLFGNVPCPIIYGAVVDSACLVWEYLCGEKGACRLYDPELFRKFFHGMTGAIMFLAFIVDGIVWYKAKHIKFSDEETPKVPEEAVPMNDEAAQSDTQV